MQEREMGYAAGGADAPAVTDINPMGTDGFEFVEYTSPNPEDLDRLFADMGFIRAARHRSKNVTLYRQGETNFIVNAEPDSFAQRFAAAHGPSACAMAFRVADASHAFRRAVAMGAKPVENQVGPMEINIPAVEGIGGSLLYFVDRYGERGSIYDIDFAPLEEVGENTGTGLTDIDHLTHNVRRGNMDQWAGFYERLFNFRELKYFDIEGKLTGLKSRAMVSACGKIRIPINESSDDKSQIEEFLGDYRGEGIQHVALGSTDIVASVDALKGRGLGFMAPPPDTYYKAVDDRVPGHGENLDELKRNGILIDGAPTPDGGRLLQIFTETVIGPIFFELIQRKGDDGFGEGNFRALFESMEQDQIRRGVLES
jgi:4-hydroxyphenylpyruvate dioxygenase